MSVTYCYVALLDVLSYRVRLQNDVQQGTYAFKDDLEDALSVFNDVNAAIYGVQAISDTIIITCKHHSDFPDLLSLLQSVFYAFLQRSLFVRGGVSYSRHFQSGRVTYSHAIARAYEIESNKAIYPRIVIDNNIIDMYQSSRKRLPDITKKGYLLKQNGVHFVDVVSIDNWLSMYSTAKAMFEHDKSYLLNNESAFEKHRWFESLLMSSPHAIPGHPGYVTSIQPV